jgi:hypothetical protein
MSQAYYGTVILQGFDTRKITGKASGALRQEFWDLELLDEITKLCYLGKLNKSVQGDRHNVLIHAFRKHKGLTYVPCSVHPSIKWNKRDPMLDPIADDMAWAIVEKHKKTETKQGLNTCNDNKVAINDFHETPIKGKKRKEITPQKTQKIKISKTQSISINNASEIEVDTQSLVPSC